MAGSIAVFVFCASAFAISMLQIGLILGAPWGEMAMGGKVTGQFPMHLRVSAAFQLLLILLCVWVVLVRAQMVLLDAFDLSRVAIWFVVGLFALSSVLNLITSSKKERLFGAPNAILMLLSSLFIALHE